MPIDIDGMHWLNAPPAWEMNQGRLLVRSDDKTDFWQETYYGFHRDNGHFLGKSRRGDFTAEVTFLGHYSELYDQAGLMIRQALDEMRDRIYRWRQTFQRRRYQW